MSYTKNMFVAASIAAALALSSQRLVAQPAGVGGDDGRGESAGQGPRRFAMGNDGRMLQMRVDRISKELELTADQQTQMNQIVEKHRKALMAPGGGTDDKAGEKMKELTTQLTDATKAHDDAKANEIRAKMRDIIRTHQEASAAAWDAFYADVATILTPDQKTKFETMKAQFGPSRPGDRMGMMNPRVLRQQVMQLKSLTAEQKAKIEALFDQFRESMRAPARGPARGADEGRKAGANNRGAAARKLSEDVMNELTKDQKEELKKNMEKAGAQGGRFGRGGRGGHGPGQPGGKGQNPPDEKDD